MRSRVCVCSWAEMHLLGQLNAFLVHCATTITITITTTTAAATAAAHTYYSKLTAEGLTKAKYTTVLTADKTMCIAEADLRSVTT